MEGIDNEVQRQIKRAERKNDMTQEQLAKVSGVSPRTIQRYECGTSRPRLDAAEKLAKALNISVDQLLGTDGMLVAQAAEQYGARGAKQAQQLTDEVTGLFTGGELAQDDMDVMMQAIMDAYWLAKEKNKSTPQRSTVLRASRTESRLWDTLYVRMETGIN